MIALRLWQAHKHTILHMYEDLKRKLLVIDTIFIKNNQLILTIKLEI